MTTAYDLLHTVQDTVAAVRASGIDCRNITIKQTPDGQVTVEHNDGVAFFLQSSRGRRIALYGPQTESLEAIAKRLATN